MQVNSYKSSLADAYCIPLNIKYNADTISVVQQKCTMHHICCMFVSRIFQHDNSSLLCNTIHVLCLTDCFMLISIMFDYGNRVLTSKLKPSLHLSCYIQLITRYTACNMLPIVQDYEYLLSVWNSSGFSKSWVTILDISDKGDFLKWVVIYTLKGFYIF